MGAMGVMGPRRLGAGPGRSGPDFEWKGVLWVQAREADVREEARYWGMCTPPCKNRKATGRAAECRDSSRLGY